LRQRVFERDHGICFRCGVDCQKALLEMKRARGPARLRLVQAWGLARNRKSLWDADHIVPVAEGGGECDLDNMRTLCLKCHKLQTSALRERLKKPIGDAIA
jgi:5-methylcytosine-specific restriction endonuclease McrA